MDKTEKRTAEAMTPTERQRIWKDADGYARLKEQFNNLFAIEAYIAGATFAHDKVRNQAIQDCIDILVDDIKIPVTSSWLEKLEQLKTKP